MVGRDGLLTVSPSDLKMLSANVKFLVWYDLERPYTILDQKQNAKSRTDHLLSSPGRSAFLKHSSATASSFTSTGGTILVVA